MVALGNTGGRKAAPALVSSPLLAALQAAGTSHIYADTADVQELREVLTVEAGGILSEVHGNTVNQPLVQKVVARYLAAADPAAWAQQLHQHQAALTRTGLMPLLYAIVCARLGNDMARAFAGARPWEVSLQLHMGLCDDPEAAMQVGHSLRQMVPSAFVKVPFTPHAPHCFLVARDLELQGIPVNFTSTFSARQAVAAGLLANVSRTNIFMGRLNQGLQAALLGEHVALEAQRALRDLRHTIGLKTQLIIASMREWQTFPRVAGCDVFTAPCEVLHDFVTQQEMTRQDIKSQLGTSYLDRLGIATEVLDKVGSERIARLYRIEPEFIEFLQEFRNTAEYKQMRDGTQIFKRLEQAGYADLFYAPNHSEWAEIRRGKLPDIAAPLTRQLPLDTLYTLLAHADFEKFQAEIDSTIGQRVSC
jgi:transaldolase